MTGLGEPGRKVYTVSELAQRLNQSLSAQFSELWVQGEITGFKKHKSGHYFFSLKDQAAKLQAIMFRFQALYLRFTPEDGLEVIVRGRLNFYEPSGELRIIVDAMEPVGKGALQLAFEQLRGRLESEGLFKAERKKPVPQFCRRVAVITSQTGAVFYDLLKVFRERNAALQILLIPSRVQGPAAENELARAIRLANRAEIASPPGRPGLDAIILARGGGALEDLWPFNTETLARAIAKSRVPIISAVGHEVDVTISDLAADLRAATPTAAAEMIAQSQAELLGRLEGAETGLKRSMVSELRFCRERIKKFLALGEGFRSQLYSLEQDIELRSHRVASSLIRQVRARSDHLNRLSQKLLALAPASWLRKNQQRLYRIEAGLNSKIRAQLSHRTETLSHLVGGLNARSPLSTLTRGYSITRMARSHKVVRNESEVNLGAALEVILQKGELAVKVEAKKERNPYEQFYQQSDEED